MVRPMQNGKGLTSDGKRRLFVAGQQTMTVSEVNDGDNVHCQVSSPLVGAS